MKPRKPSRATEGRGGTPVGYSPIPGEPEHKENNQPPEFARFSALRQSCKDRPHGTTARYAVGCRCALCRAAVAEYARERKRARKAGDFRGLVSAEPARQHLRKLTRQGVGKDAVAAACDVGLATLAEIRSGRRTQIRAHHERRILSVDVDARADGSFVSAGATWRLIDRLVEYGYTKAQLAEWLGYKECLQFGRRRVRAKTASRVERLYRLIEQGRFARSGEVRVGRVA